MRAMTIMMTNAAENILSYQITLWYLKNHKLYKSHHILMHCFVQTQEGDQPLSFIKVSILNALEVPLRSPSSVHQAGFFLTPLL